MESQPNWDAAMRREVRATLHANAAAPYATILTNWQYRYQVHGAVDATAETRLAAIYAEEQQALGAHSHRGANRPWWRFW
jgi:hypothetical protein